jgi:hypothetical protein
VVNRWLHWDNTTLHGNFDRPVAVELYDHRDDDGTDPDTSENVNTAAAAPDGLIKELHMLLVAGFPVV